MSSLRRSILGAMLLALAASPALGAPAVIQAVLPPVPQVIPQTPDAVWVKTYVTEMSTAADLNELISYDPNNLDPTKPSVAPQLPSEIEVGWELLPGDGSQNIQHDVSPADATLSIVRRYEYYQYTGGYDEVHMPTSLFTTGDPLPSELGQFIAANMVAANLLQDVPEPSALAFLIGGASLVTLRSRRKP